MITSMRQRIMLPLSLVLLLTWTVGCYQLPTDEEIQKNIQARAASDPQTKDSDVTVSTIQGKVTLRDKVKELQTIAKAEPGVYKSASDIL